MKKSSYNAPRYNPRTIHPADKAKGDEGERRFQQWLNDSLVAFYYLDQTPLSVPEHLRGQLKRADYVVGVPGIGAVSFDVKVKALYNGHFIFDYDEIVRMRNFARLFHYTVYFACLDPDGSAESYWLRLDQFDSLMPVRQGSALVVKIPADVVQSVSMRKPFQDALAEAVRLA